MMTNLTDYIKLWPSAYKMGAHDSLVCERIVALCDEMQRVLDEIAADKAGDEWRRVLAKGCLEPVAR